MVSFPVILLSLGAAAALASHPPDPLRGTWRNPSGSVTIRIDTCGARLCGWVATASAEAVTDAQTAGTEHLIGARLFENYRREGSNRWSGEVFVPDLARRFSSHISLVDHDHARVAGCLLGLFLCQSQIWVRQP